MLGNLQRRAAYPAGKKKKLLLRQWENPSFRHGGKRKKSVRGGEHLFLYSEREGERRGKEEGENIYILTDRGKAVPSLLVVGGKKKTYCEGGR